MSMERRIEKLEEQSNPPELPEKYVSLLSRLSGFRERYDLGDNPSREEVEAAIYRMRKSRGIRE